jgi:hypothetical protein
LRLKCQRAQARGLRFGILVALLEAEGVHADHERVAGHARGPVRQDARDAVAEVQRIAAEEVHEVRHLQRHDVARAVDQHAVERFGAGVPFTGGQQARGGGEGLLARGRADERLVGGIERGDRVVGEATLEERHEDQGLGAIRGGEGRIQGEGLVQRGDRVAAEGAGGDERALVGLQGGGLGEGDGQAAGVFVHGGLR